MYSDSLNERWNEVCQRVSTYPNVDLSQFNALIEQLKPQAMSEGFLLLTTSTSFLKNWAERNFLQSIQQALMEIYNIPFTVSIEIDDSTPAVQQKPDTNQREISQTSYQPSPYEPSPRTQNISTPINQTYKTLTPDTDQPTLENIPTSLVTETQGKPSMNPDQMLRTLTFENFVIGESNRLAYSLAVQVAEVPGRTSLNPLFIYGKSGLGKTHLMRAIQNYINETQPHLNTVYVDSEELISGYTDAVAEHDREKSSYKNFKTKYESADVLLIDDIQFLQGKIQTLDIVFQIFNKLISQGKQIVLSADRAPKNIDIEERYSSRFAQGGTVDIQPPEIETKLAIVKSFINEYRLAEGNENLVFPEEVQMYIAENSGSNIRELKGAVTIVIYHINFSNNENLTISDVSTILENHFSGLNSKNLTVEDIQKQVAQYYKIKQSDLIGTNRSREYVIPRQIAIYLCRQLTDLSLNNIAKKFNKDHSTAVHSVSKVEDDLLKNRDIQEEIETLKQLIKEM